MINLRQMAEDEVCFRFESNADKREFWELFSGSKYSNRNLTDILMQDNATHFKIFVYHNEIFYAYSKNSWKYPTWTEIKERYEMKDDVIFNVKGVKQAVDNCIKNIKELQTHQAITLLQSLGYKVEAPYTEPTDEEM